MVTILEKWSVLCRVGESAMVTIGEVALCRVGESAMVTIGEVECTVSGG